MFETTVYFRLDKCGNILQQFISHTPTDITEVCWRRRCLARITSFHYGQAWNGFLLHDDFTGALTANSIFLFNLW